MKEKLLFGLLLVVFACRVESVQASVLTDLRQWLQQPENTRGDIKKQAFAAKSLTKEEAEAALQMMAAEWQKARKSRFEQIWKTQSITQAPLTMRFKFKVYGEKPADGRSLYISMHGGGGTTPDVNDQQWENQIQLYQPKEGVYVAPRSLQDVWNMWFLPLDGFYRELIQSAVAVYGVNPDKVYITGYSAGGDGTFRMATRMADYWAAALMCAGHPGDTSPLSLRNLPFGLWVGLADAPYQRNIHALEWKGALRALHENDPEGYVQNVNLPQTQHWMNRADTAAFAWMGQFRRNLFPDKVVWKQDSTYTNPSLYWVSVPGSKIQKGGVVEVSHIGNIFTIERCYSDELVLLLNDRLIDYSKPVTVMYRNKVLFSAKVKRTLATLYESFYSRGDSVYDFPTKISVKVR